MLAVQSTAQTRYGFRIAYENYGIAIGATDQVFNGLKLNFIDVDYYQVRGINISAFNFSQSLRHDRRNIIWGANIGLMANGGRCYGVSLFPFGNFQDDIRGVSFGFLNSGYMRSGLTGGIAWIKAVDEGIYGAAGSLGVIKAKKIKGFAAAPIIFGLYQDYKYYRMELRGAAFSLFIYSNYMDGLSVSLVNYNRLVHGVNIGVVNWCEKMTGLQFGFLNSSDTTDATDAYVDPENAYKIARKKRVLVQIGAINNSQQRFTTQFGLVNKTCKKYCVQYGLININTANKKPFRVMPFVNFHFGTNERIQEKQRINEEHKRVKELEKEIRKRNAEARKKQKKVERNSYLR